MARWKLGDVKLKDIEAAIDVEDAAFSQIHMAVTKQLTRLEVEENMLKLLMSKLEQENGGPIAAAPPQGGNDAGGGEELRGHEAPPSNQPAAELEEGEGGEGANEAAAAAAAAARSSEFKKTAKAFEWELEGYVPKKDPRKGPRKGPKR